MAKIVILFMFASFGYLVWRWCQEFVVYPMAFLYRETWVAMSVYFSDMLNLRLFRLRQVADLGVILAGAGVLYGLTIRQHNPWSGYGLAILKYSMTFMWIALGSTVVLFFWPNPLPLTLYIAPPVLLGVVISGIVAGLPKLR